MIAGGGGGVIPKELEGADRPNPFVWQAGAGAASSDDSMDEEVPEDVVGEEGPVGSGTEAPPPACKKWKASAGKQTTVEGNMRRHQDRIIGVDM